MILIASLFLAGPGVCAEGPTAAEFTASAKSALAGGNKDLAIYYFRRAVKLEPQQLEARVWLAQALLKRGNIDQAADEARAVLAMQKGHAEAQAVLDAIRKPSPTPTPVPIEADVASVPFPQPSDDALPKGLAAWVFGPATPAAKQLNEYSQSVPMSQRFSMVFVPAGELVIKDGKVSLQFDTKLALEMAEKLIGDVRVLPVIKGNSRGATQVGAEEWDRVGAQIAAALEADTRLGGLQFDVQPQMPQLFGLYAATKNHTRKPVTAVVKDWHKLIFKYVDAVVLQGFGRASALQDYAGAVKAVINLFLQDARAMDGKAIIGLPAAAAIVEFELRSDKAGAATQGGIATGVSMDQYFKEGVFAVQSTVIVNDPAFLAIAIWAIHPEGGIRPNLEARWYFPSLISEKIWQRLQLPLLEGR